MIKNLVTSEEPKTFYVWINPKDMYTMHNARIGSFVSVRNKEDNLMFLPNPKFSGYISPFQENLLKTYLTEYLLEVERKDHFNDYPSRLSSTFLFDSEQEALIYRDTHMSHVSERELKKCNTVGKYTYSKHDLGWVDFLRSPFIVDDNTKAQMVTSYWKGVSVIDFTLEITGNPIKAITDSVFEILFTGRIDFER